MKYKYLFIIVISLFSCSDKKDVVNEVILYGEKVKIDSENENSRPVWLLGDNFYARDIDHNIISGKLKKTEWQRAEKIFVAGHGHDEFGMVAMSYDNNGALYVLNRPFSGDKLLSLTKIMYADNIAIGKNPKNWEKYDLLHLPPFFQYADNFVVMSDSTILVTGAPAKDMRHLLSIVNFKNQTITPLEYWPDDDTPEEQLNEKFMVYTVGSAVLWNGKDRFLYWDDSGKVAFIFSIEGKKVNVLRHIYKDSLPTPSSGKNPSTERISCCADNDKIYLLYKNSNSKGEKMDKFDIRDPFPMGNTVEVYDWDGVKHHVAHLDKLGRTIMISKDSKTLYLYSEDMMDESDQYLYSYDLSSLN